MPRIVIISDTHEQHAEVIVPEGDILIHCGDFTYRGEIPAIANFAHWFGKLPHASKLIIAGNHELTFDSSRSRNLVINMLQETGSIYLQDTSCVIDDITFYGSSFTPAFCNWAFNLPRGGHELAREWAQIPEETNVLITHGPPYGILDDTINDGSQGCELLRDRVKQLTNLKLHCFGHLHHGYGTIIQDGVIFANAACCTETYKPTNPPIIIDL